VTAPTGQPLRGQLRPVQDSTQVDAEHPVGHRIVFVDEPSGRHDAGVVHQDVECAEADLGVVEKCRECLAAGDVQRQAADVAAGQLGQFDSCFLDQLGVDIAERNPGTRTQKRHTGRLADAPSASGDRDDLAADVVVANCHW
jgi:hypothetical protein